MELMVAQGYRKWHYMYMIGHTSFSIIVIVITSLTYTDTKVLPLFSV